ncbi:glycine/sarcosine/betaine reductase complex component C subunit beta [Clostridiaceae bacterium HSG29]|nr:glycine/sarcosine/betaine reductase complex component C subunit beta [Clostridiaceae bacterium HSG29]
MNYSVIKSSGYILVHTPDMVLQNGTTQTVERLSNPESEYLKAVNNHLRSYDEVVSYAPNQVYIGNVTPAELGEIEKPWFKNNLEKATRQGKFGEIMPQDEFIAMIKMEDVFDLVKLDKEFVKEVMPKLEANTIISENKIKNLGEGVEYNEIKELVDVQHSEPIFNDSKLVGCVKRAHDVDVNLNAHVMLENLVVKASGVIAFENLIKKNNINVEDIDYVIECSEEACGDMNQRGGGNFAKAIAESVGAINSTGSDVRGFCAGPIHAFIYAASLVKAGTYDNVVVVAGGATAKLGMNGKDHVKKEMPILEDTLGGFAFLISKNDGISPIIRTDLTGRHTVGTGSSPQAVIGSLIMDPIEKAGLTINDIDKYSVEMQNPDITKPAGAGDVPEANYKMIAAMGVKTKQIERKDMMNFIKVHGMPGWAPTQGHIPSGVPYLGFAKDDMTTGDVNRAMIVGKGSLFLGRMTNLFDGASVILERNPGKVEEEKIDKDEVNKLIANALRNFGMQMLED